MKSSQITFLISFIAAVLGILCIAFINYQIIGNWFGKDGTANLGSIEVSYVTMGRFLADFGMPFGGWIPQWYFGFPFHLFYTPLLPFLEFVLNKSNDMPLWEAYRFLTGIAYIVGPISVLFLGWQLSKNVTGGIIAGILYSVSPTIFYAIESGVAGDRISADFWDIRRFTVLVRWGEGPHLFSLMFMPLAGVFFIRFLENKKFGSLFLASLFLGLTALSNAIGFFSAVLLMVSITFVKFAQTPGNRRNVLISGFITGFLSLGLISFWYNLSFISNFFGEGGGTGKMYLNLFPWGWLGAVVVVALLFLIFQKVIKDFAVATGLFWFLLFFTVVFVYYQQGIELLPQALRYNIEVDLSLSLLIGVSFAWLITYAKKRLWIFEYVGLIVCGLFTLAAFIYIQPFNQTAAKATETVVDLTKTSEYKIASWMNTYVDQKKGERVVAPGNYGFFLNWFSNVWQIRGALFQASTHDWADHIYYQLSNGMDKEISHAWLVASNIKYFVASPSEMYHDIKNADRFSDYPIVGGEGADVVYKVPLKRESLAKPINLSQMESLVIPKKGDDKKPILDYANWVENSSNNETALIVTNNNSSHITGTINDGEGILVQMTADPGWSAFNKVSQKNIRVGRDPLGFIVLYPETGHVDITLKHGVTWKEWLGYFITLLTIVGMIWYSVMPRKKPIQLVQTSPVVPNQHISDM